MLDSATSTVATSATTTTTATPSTSEAEDVTSTKTLEADRIFVLMQKDYRWQIHFKDLPLGGFSNSTWHFSSIFDPSPHVTFVKSVIYVMWHFDFFFNFPKYKLFTSL